MALLWMDGFDHYGTGATGVGNMHDGVWAEIAKHTPQAGNPRTGSYAMGANAVIQDNSIARRVLGGAKTAVGLGMAFWVGNLPSANARLALFDFRDTANAVQVMIVLQSTGVIAAYRGNLLSPVLLGESASPAVTAEAYQHIEARVGFSQTAGTVEVRVNGVTVLNLSGVDTCATANVEASQVSFFTTINAGTGITGYWFDDVFAWDDSGTENNGFLGDRRVRTFFTNADTAVAEWSKVGATDGYDCINDAVPDDDTTYIQAAPLTGSPVDPIIAEFSLEDPPVTIGAIAAMQTYCRMRKTQAGDANVEVSMLSGSSADAGADRPLTEQYTYWMDVSELNPDTGTPWNYSSLTAAKVRIKRTA